ncbi:MAG: sulfite exporter TauE/SafE family protein [Candidatus Dormibacteria bacterium]
MNVPIALAGLIVGFVVGMTGMGGGALMTPVLILVFGVSAPAAVSSDLVASVIMRPVGAAVHLRRGTVQGGLVLWLSIGSVPMAFVGVLLIKVLAHGQQIQNIVQLALGAALLVSAGAMVLKALINLRQRARGEHLQEADHGRVPVRRVPTLLIGALGGLVVGMTSVGSGSLIIACLLFLYPWLKASQLVGTDLVQAMPLVASAALGHLIFGDVQFALTVALVIGSVPGVFLGALVSSLAPPRMVRRALAIVLTASGLKLVGVPTVELGIVLVAVLIAGPLLWALIRRADGFAKRALAAHPADAHSAGAEVGGAAPHAVSGS